MTGAYQHSADLFQLGYVLARLDAFVEQRDKHCLEVVQRSAVVNALRVREDVDEEQRVATWPEHTHTHTHTIHSNM